MSENASHPVMRFLFKIFSLSNRSVRNVAAAGGISHTAFFEWFRGNWKPRFENLEAVLNSLGFGFEIVPIDPEKVTWLQFEAMERVNEELREAREVMCEALQDGEKT